MLYVFLLSCVTVCGLPLFCVGAGKTMLMDLFFTCARVAKKHRVHFNSFMLDVHDSEQKATVTQPVVSPEQA